MANYVGPRLARDAPFPLILVVGQGCALVLAGAVVLIQGAPIPGAVEVAWGLLAGLGNGVGVVLFYRAAAHGPLSIVTPVSSLAVLLPVTVGLAGGEQLGTRQGAGIALALGGLLLVVRQPPVAEPVPAGAPPPVRPAHYDRALVIGLSLACAVNFGVFLAAVKPAADGGAAWAVLVTRISAMAVFLALAVRAAALTGARGRRLVPFAIPGTLLFFGTFAYAAATQRGDLSTVSVLGTLFPVVTVGLALGLDRERIALTAGAGTAMTIAGVILLSTS